LIPLQKAPFLKKALFIFYEPTVSDEASMPAIVHGYPFIGQKLLFIELVRP
jgi:hypothetical protein